jgi:SAM-dependent methyltransferase
MVAADRYDEEYYLHTCGGSEEWRRSDGAEMAGVYPGSLQEARLAEGEVVVDIGTGRGELLVAALERGAAQAIGVEYSPAAVKLAQQTLDVNEINPDRGRVVEADARSVPLPDGVADLVTMLDVVEHLAPDELSAALRQAHRLLRPGGRILIHTFPTRTLYDVTYRLQRWARPSRIRTWPRDPRKELEHVMHVNEQSVRRLRRALRGAAFAEVDVRPGVWVYTEFLPDPDAARLYHRLARFGPTARFGVSNLWGRGVRAELP